MAKIGRPPGNSEARQQLVDAARALFTALPFKKVSTRMVAEAAGVNSALIHYYFSDKLGLYETMLLETLEPLRKYFDNEKNSEPPSIENFIRTYYRAMSPNADVPKLIFRTMSDQADIQHPVIKGIMEKMVARGGSLILDNDKIEPRLKSGLRADFSKLTVISMTIFPFIVPESVLKLQNLSLTEDDFLALAEHQIQVLKHGLLNDDVS